MPTTKTNILNTFQYLALILLFAYDVFTYVPEHISMSFLKVAYYCVITLLFILQSNNRNTINATNNLIGINGMAFMWLFFVSLYFTRVIYDLYVVHIEQHITTYQYTLPFLFFCSAILPVFLFRHMDYTNIDYTKIAKILVCILAVFISISFYRFLIGDAPYVEDVGRMAGNQSMDTIAFGHWGLSLVIYALYSLSNSLSNHRKYTFIYIVPSMLGLLALVAAGSRGALVAALCCGMFVLYTYGHKFLAISIIPAFVLCFYFVYPFINEMFEYYNIRALERFYNSLFSISDATILTTRRDILYIESLKSIQSHPLFGYSFLLEDGQYAHNFIIESFLALGVLGGLLFIVLSMVSLSQAFRLVKINRKYLLISTLYIQYLVYGFFSRSMSILPIFWVLTYLIVYSYQFETTNNSDHA